MKNSDSPAMPIENYQLAKSIKTDGRNLFAGLTKREMIAMHVMSSAIGGIMANSDPSAKTTPKETSELAVAYADALLAELDK
ncbi:hypothetical protein NVP1246O_35 [Vibrio phage 1.246.O._10N.261.54.E10]|nr:hypothetical protein NVP1246O_35 [Vibrio phage 1.246.O._10N.261.54.E10]